MLFALVVEEKNKRDVVLLKPELTQSIIEEAFDRHIKKQDTDIMQ